MRLLWFFALGLLFAYSSCSKDLPAEYQEPIDPRDEVIGTYKGIKVFTCWSGTGSIYNHDTTEAEVILSKGDSISVIEVTLNPLCCNDKSTFTYSDSVFKSTRLFYPQTLEVSASKLYFYHRGSKGPVWTEYFAQKTL